MPRTAVPIGPLAPRMLVPVTTTDSIDPDGKGAAPPVAGVCAVAALAPNMPKINARIDVEFLNDIVFFSSRFLVSSEEIVTIPSVERLTFRPDPFSIRSRATKTS